MTPTILKRASIGCGTSNIGPGSGDITQEGDGYAIPNGDGIVDATKPGI